MHQCGLFKLLPITVFVCSCTFGEGPELVDPEPGKSSGEIASSGAPSATDSTQTQEVNGLSTDAVDDGDQTNGTAVNGAAVNMQGNLAGDTDAATSINNVDVSDSNQSGETDNPQSANSTGGSQDPIVRIPRTDRGNAPKIDGDTLDYIEGTELLDGEWRFAAQFNEAGEPLGINNFMFGNADQSLSGSYHHWAAVHDGEYLYLVVIIDDDGMHYQDSNEERKPWKDDSVELFFDGNNSLLAQYDGVDDFHLTVNLQESPGVPNASYGSSPNIRQSTQSASFPSDFLFQTGIRKGPQPIGTDRVRKDIYEFRIKLSELNIQIETPFGIEVQMNDDDDGGTRDAKWAWHHPEGVDSTNDYTWQIPSFMGTAILIR